MQLCKLTTRLRVDKPCREMLRSIYRHVRPVSAVAHVTIYNNVYRTLQSLVYELSTNNE